MIVFTFPGQGSQKPGMGRAWADHPSWELVSEASAAAGRDVGWLLLEADADDLRQTRNAQLATFVLSLVVLDAVERLGVEPARFAGHSLGEYTALAAAGARRLRRRRPARRRAGRGDAGGGRGPHRHHGRRARPRRRRRRDRLPPGRRQRLGGQLQRTRAGGDRRRPDAIDAAGGFAKELGAKRVMGLDVGGAFHTPFMAPARDLLTQGPRRGRRAQQRRPRHRQRRRPAPLASRRVGHAARRPSCAARSAGARRSTTSSGLASPPSSSSDRAPCSPAWPSAPSPPPGPTPVALPTTSTTCSRRSPGISPTSARRGRAPVHDRAHRRQPGAGIFVPDPGIAPGESLTVGHRLGAWPASEVVSPFDGTAHGLARQGRRAGHDPQPIAWLRTA